MQRLNELSIIKIAIKEIIIIVRIKTCSTLLDFELKTSCKNLIALIRKLDKMIKRLSKRMTLIERQIEIDFEIVASRLA